MKTLYLARHAKSSWNSSATSDFNRPLDNRGITDSVKIGNELKRLDWHPEKIIASPAVRVKQTCQTYCEILKFPVDNVQWNEDIYAARTITLLHRLSKLDESTNSAMLVGHNPAIEDLLIQLCGFAQVKKIQQNDGKIFTTANVAKLTTDEQWKDIISSEMKLEKFLRPKEI